MGLMGYLGQNRKDKKQDINQKLRKLKPTPVKFDLTKVNDDKYVVFLNFPYKFKFLGKSEDSSFCTFFKLQKCIQPGVMIAPNIKYTSENIKEVVAPFSVIEWHCNIIEFSYANHDEHQHLHKHDELLHVSFVDNSFYETPVYKEIPKNPVFVPLRNGLQEIREIILTPLGENNNNIENLKDVVVYLQLKEE
jgi:hypothetical protein